MRRSNEFQAPLERLMFAIREMVDRGEIIPCLDQDRGWLWISDYPEAQEAAALGCGTCPALKACRDYALHNPEPFGVWAGHVNGKPVSA